MGRLFLFSILLSYVMSAGSQAQLSQWEIQGAYEMMFPCDDMWDKSHGGEVKAIYWQTSNIGLGFFTGLSQWDIDSKATSVNPDITRSWSGDVQYIPLGISVLYHHDLDISKPVSVTWETGLCYLFVDDDIQMTETVQVPIGGGQTLTEVDTYHADATDSLTARLAVNIEWIFNSEQATAFFGAGYQFDLDEGEATVDTLIVREPLEVKGFFIRLGVAVPF